jgi:methyl-accepting chemotaxis protein
MKLRIKLLILPALGGAMMIALCVLVTLMLQRANAELNQLADVRFASYAAAQQVRGQLSALHAEAYRTLVGIGTLKPAALAGQRDAFRRSAESLGGEVKRQLAGDPGGGAAGLRALAEGLPRFAASVDAAIDRGRADPDTGMAALQSVDGAYRELAGHADAVLGAERQLAGASVAAARARDRRSLFIVWGATLATVIAALATAVGFNRRLLQPLDAAREAADSIAGGNLRVSLPPPSADEIGQLVAALGRMADHLKRTVGSIKGSADQIATASNEIAVGNGDLSQRTEQQASSLQQTSSSMDALTATVATNADNARQANQLALGASDVARRGGDVVDQVVSTMGEISDSSRKIADIIGVIDGIAFQTNILALNAAVEAARAGEQGRGFSVVAAEVRSLAQRSAEAARQIKGLIGDSVQRVESGSRLVKEAGATMAEIVTSVRRVTDIIGEISSATSEQSSGIGQVNTAVVQLDRMTQQNAALVEQSAAAAESLKEQARRLAEAIGTFRLDDAPTRWSGSGRASGPQVAPRQPPVDAAETARARPGHAAATPSRPAPQAAGPAAVRPAPSSPKQAVRSAGSAAPPTVSTPRPQAVAPAPATRHGAIPAGGAAPAGSPAAAAAPADPARAPVSKPAAAPAPKPSGASAPRAASAYAPKAAAAPAPKPVAARPTGKAPDDDWEEF